MLAADLEVLTATNRGTQRHAARSVPCRADRYPPAAAQKAEIVNKEIGFLQSEMNTVATCSALLAGFAFSALNLQTTSAQAFNANTTDLRSISIHGKEIFFCTFVSLTFTFNLLCVFSSTFLGACVLADYGTRWPRGRVARTDAAAVTANHPVPHTHTHTHARPE
jgi:hypothetical protein